MNQEQINKPFSIPKPLVYNAWKEVKANKGSAGIDQVSIKDYSQSLSSNLYKLWNRMSSGSYFPHPVKLVKIPKKNGGKRPLGIPTVEDRIAQSTVVLCITERLEKEFHRDTCTIVRIFYTFARKIFFFIINPITNELFQM